jgi:hypothetical protein
MADKMIALRLDYLAAKTPFDQFERERPDALAVLKKRGM